MKIPPIPEKLFFKIGEVADLAGIEQHVLRYWEEEIESLKPKKNKSGQRLYQKKDVELIFEIKQLLYAEKFTLAGARKKLKKNKKETHKKVYNSFKINITRIVALAFIFELTIGPKVSMK